MKKVEVKTRTKVKRQTQSLCLTFLSTFALVVTSTCLVSFLYLTQP